MTKKEAAEKLQQESKLICHGCMHPQEVGWCKNHCKLPEAFDMAIETLTNTPNTLNALDTIYRQAAIDRINKQRKYLQPDVYPQDKIGDSAYRICAEFIEQLPSAQQKPLKYTGDSICLYCQTINCDGCMYEPMEGVQ